MSLRSYLHLGGDHSLQRPDWVIYLNPAFVAPVVSSLGCHNWRRRLAFVSQVQKAAGPGIFTTLLVKTYPPPPAATAAGLLLGIFKTSRGLWIDMADTLRRLTNTSSFSVLQDKLESWHKDYHVSSSISHDWPKSDHTTSSVLASPISMITIHWIGIFAYSWPF